MSFQSLVEHNWVPMDVVPRTLQGMFPSGACLVFADEEFVAAIPATNKQTNDLADLFESCAVALDDDFTGSGADYDKMRDELCSPKGWQMLAELFNQEIAKVEVRKKAQSMLASAARPKNYQNN